MSQVTVRVVKDFDEFLSLEESWDALVNSIEHHLPFQTHGWIRLWCRNFLHGKSLNIITIWNGEKLVGVLPLEKRSDKVMKFFRLRSLHSLTNGNAVAFNIICSLKDLKMVLNAIKTYLIHSRDWGKVELNYVPVDFGAVDALVSELTGNKLHVLIKRGEGSYYIDIQGEFDDYFNTLGKTFQKNGKNNNNRLARLGKVEFDVVNTYEEQLINGFYDLEDSGWKHERGHPIKARTELVKFYNEVAEEFSRKGQFILATVRIADEPIASAYGLLFKGTFYFIKVAVNYSNQEFSKRSPGKILLEHLIKYCFKNKVRKFDFYGPCYPDEAHWCKKVNQKYSIIIFNRRNFIIKVYLFLKNIRSIGNVRS